eukprot:1776007-Prymnesium_polylepis.1
MDKRSLRTARARPPPSPPAHERHSQDTRRRATSALHRRHGVRLPGELRSNPRPSSPRPDSGTVCQAVPARWRTGDERAHDAPFDPSRAGLFVSPCGQAGIPTAVRSFP